MHPIIDGLSRSTILIEYRVGRSNPTISNIIDTVLQALPMEIGGQMVKRANFKSCRLRFESHPRYLDLATPLRDDTDLRALGDE